MKAFHLLLIAYTLFFRVSTAHAESPTPEEVVHALVKAAQENNLQAVLNTTDLVRIAVHPRHGKSPADLIEFLKGINLNKIQFQEIKREELPQRVIVRITAPVNIDFELELVKADEKKQANHYKVVAVHP